jgi:hypothetical protein
MHIFIMSKIRHRHKKYDTRKQPGTNHGLNRAKVWPAGHITLVGQPCVGAFSKTILSMCPVEAVLKVFNAQRRCKQESIQIRWSFLSSSSVECGSSARILQILTES